MGAISLLVHDCDRRIHENKNSGFDTGPTVLIGIDQYLYLLESDLRTENIVNMNIGLY